MVQDAAVSKPVTRGIVETVVDADDDVERRVVLDRRRDDDPLHAAVEIALKLVGLQELAGAFEHDVAAEIAPGHVARRRGGAEPERVLLIVMALSSSNAERAVPAAVDAVEFQEMGGGGRAALDLVEMTTSSRLSARGIAVRRGRMPPSAARSASRPIRPMPLMPTPMLRSPYGAVRMVSPISSSRAFIAILSSASNGRLVKISRRRRIMA